MNPDLSTIKCIAFDLDDTILNHRMALSERTWHALIRAAGTGKVLLPVSGRPFSGFPPSVLWLPSVHYAVTGNGASVFDVSSGEALDQYLLAEADVRAIMRRTDSFFMDGWITYEAFMDDAPYAAADYVRDPMSYGLPAIAASYEQRIDHPVRTIVDFIHEHAARLTKLDLILSDPGLFDILTRTIRREVPGVYITSSAPYRLEMTHADSGKAAGMRHALKRMGLTPSQAIAFGNGDNDADMLSAAGIGVAVQNASTHCKACADFVTDLTADEDGVADFLEKWSI